MKSGVSLYCFILCHARSLLTSYFGLASASELINLFLEVQEVLKRLSPPPSEHEYIFNLNQGESLADLFQDDCL